MVQAVKRIVRPIPRSGGHNFGEWRDLVIKLLCREHRKALNLNINIRSYFRIKTKEKPFLCPIEVLATLLSLIFTINTGCLCDA
jgi:hypothetical protein